MAIYRTEPLLPTPDPNSEGETSLRPPSEADASPPQGEAPSETRGMTVDPHRMDTVDTSSAFMDQASSKAQRLFTQVLVGAEPPLSHRPTVAANEGSKTEGAHGEALSGHVLSGKYELGKRLGVGGMGAVYRASHLSLGIDVAIKIMHPQVAQVDEYARRFRREAHAASLLGHRNVVRVLDFGEDNGVLFLVMELLRGQTLSAWLAQSASPPPISECVEILSQVLDAFEAAHAAGIVHRDLKPENVFLSVEADGKRLAKVVDFGLAHVDDHRDVGPTLTKADIVSGTPEYMSPEQCRSLAVGPSTDIYAMGCLLTDMLQLRPPFSGNAIEVMTQQMFVPPPPLRRPAGAEPVPPLLERLRLSLLAKSTEQRPEDVREIKRLLLEATNAAAAAQRLPGRKEEGARGELRIPAPKTPTLGQGAPLNVRIAHLEGDGGSAWESIATGLAAQGIGTLLNDEDIARAQAIVLNAEGNVEAAVAWLGRAPKGTPTVVCLKDVTADRMSALIAAGAKDIVPYPITSDVLARKLRRATKSR